MPMNNRLLRPLQTPGLLDLVPGAAAAYSLRSLSRSYAGPVVTVRRSSDDAEEDFTAAEVSDGTLAAFCGAGDGFVKTWHSQTRSNSVSKTSTSLQPKIVSSGVVILEEGKPAIQFDGIDDFLETGNFTATTQSGAFAVAVFSPTVSASVHRIVDHDNFLLQSYSATPQYNGGFVYKYGGTYYGAGASTDLPQRQQILSGGRIGNDVKTFADGALRGSFTRTSTLASTTSTFKVSSAALPFDGTIQELLIYPSDQSANRELIEGNIAWSYSV